MPDNVTALLAMSGGGSVDPEKIAEVASEWLEENLATPSTPPIDSSLTVANAAADAKAAGDAIRAQNASLISPTAKQALLDCFAHVAWVDDHGQEYYDALEAALFTEAELQSISAVYTQSGTVYDTDSLDSLKADLVVTALYGDGSTQTVPAESYTLSGTLTEGTSTITVSYGGKTATFDVTVTVIDTSPVITDTGKYLNSSGSLVTNQDWCVTDFYETSFSTLPYTLVVGFGENGGTSICLCIYDSEKVKTNQYSCTPQERELAWKTTAPPPYFRTSLYGDGSDGYAYIKETGKVIFAGENTPYYGKANIND